MSAGMSETIWHRVLKWDDLETKVFRDPGSN